MDNQAKLEIEPSIELLFESNWVFKLKTISSF